MGSKSAIKHPAKQNFPLELGSVAKVGFMPVA